MVAGGGASVIYADTICALGGSEELGRGNNNRRCNVPVLRIRYRYSYCRTRKLTIVVVMSLLVVPGFSCDFGAKIRRTVRQIKPFYIVSLIKVKIFFLLIFFRSRQPVALAYS
jgi:hypothetical protein